MGAGRPISSTQFEQVVVLLREILIARYALMRASGIGSLQRPAVADLQRQTRTRGFIQALSHGIRNIMIKMNFRNAIQEIYMHIAKIGLAFVVARKRIIASQVQ
jgi:hypothetical protein